MNRIAFACLWLFVFTIPWERSLQLGGESGSVGRVAGFLALGMGLWAVGSQGRMRRLGAFHILALAFLMLVSVSFFWTADPVDSPHTIRVYYQSMWVLWLIWEFAQDQQRLSQLRIAFVLGECVLVALTVQTFLNGRILDRAKEARFSAEGWGPNPMAIMLVMGVPFACYMAVRSESLWERWIGIVSLILIPFGVLLTSSRNGLIGLAISMLTLPLLLRRYRASTKMLFVVVLLIAVFVGVIVLPSQTWLRLATIGEDVSRGGMNDRVGIWKYGMMAFPAHSWVGVGAGAWQAGTGNFFAPHNTYLEVLVEEGMAGFTLYLLILGSVTRGIVSSRGANRVASGVLMVSFLVCTMAIHLAESASMWFVLGWIIAQGSASETPDCAVTAGEAPGLLAAEVGSMLSPR